MAKQKSIIKLEGTIGDITFFKSGDGYMAREATSVSADKIANDPSYQRTRENMSEFSRAGKAGKTLRDAVRVLLKNAKDSRVTSRLTKQMMSVLMGDTKSARGQRTVVNGDITLLQGFDFNIEARLSTMFFAKYSATIDRAAGTATIAIPGSKAEDDIELPAGATHYSLVTLAAEVDFEAEKSVTASQQSDFILCSNAVQPDLNLVNNVTPNSKNHIFLLFGIQFSQLVNGQQYPLKNGSFNSLSIVKVDKGA